MLNYFWILHRNKLKEGSAAWSSAELKEIHLDTKQKVPLETGSTCHDSYLTAAALGDKVRPKNCKEKNWTKGDKPKNTLQPLKQSFDFIDLNKILLTWKNHMEENVKLRKCPQSLIVQLCCRTFMVFVRSTWEELRQDLMKVDGGSSTIHMQTLRADSNWLRMSSASQFTHAEFGRGATTECRDSVREWRRKTGLFVSLFKNILT